jgi:predicted methyltransferase
MNKSAATTLAIMLAVTFVACGKPSPDEKSLQSGDASASPDLRTLLAGPTRPDADKSRDPGRKPVDVIRFLGIAPGMRVLDVIAGGGYYTEVLSLAVGPTGQVVAQNPDRVLKFRDGANEKAISARLVGNRLPNVRRMNKNFDEIAASDGPFDAAMTALNFHDIYNGSGADAAVEALKSIASVLKPGAVFGVIDHVGVADADNTALHRIEIDKAIETAKAAGFIVEGQSDLLRNGSDDHSQGVFAEGVRGNTDRFILKLRKPGG